ncbi:hydroxymethylbilane synthase [Propionibacteriaceae bacterium G57]|uniref:hydroxymethylbilane synthase n=1 Tax=Aestuariimicrobium sp. G57 TaxID=3418485 RepID=UPI003DA7364C
MRIGTRASLLARTQSQMVADALAVAAGGTERAELEFISTEGDVNLAPLERIGGTGVFVSAVRDALLDGRVDLVVHSMKDLPTAPADGITLVAVPQREDPRDVLVARDGLTLATLPQGARVGTGSARRAAQLLAVRPDLQVSGLRGNIDTRLGKVGELDAVVLAAAGLARAGRGEHVTEFLDPTVMLPAAAQGALAIECRADDLDSVAARLAAGLDDAATRARTVAERAFLARLEAGCTAPVGALAEVHGDELVLQGLAISRDGAVRFAGQLTGGVDDAAGVGVRLAERLLDDGAGVVLAG